MYPNRSVMDYMAEINRLYSKSSESEMFQSTPPSNIAPSNASIGSFSQSSMARSSSSTDTSPESFPDLTSHQFRPELEGLPKRHLYQRTTRSTQEYEYRHFDREVRPEKPFESLRGNFETRSEQNYEDIRNEAWIHPELRNLRTEYHTPTIVKRQRPIIGRKIMATETPILKPVDEFNPNMMWHLDNLPHTPPRSFEQKYTPNTPPRSFEQHTQNTYELFPAEHKAYEFPSPVKSSPHASPSLASPKTMTSLSPPPRSPFSPRMSTPFKEPFVGPASYTNYGQSKMCTFCKKNGETPLVYTTHTVKEKVGNKNVVTCPILRSHVCTTCGASGDNAHTITYCPVLRIGNNGQPLQSTTITLKNTRVKSNGRRRY